MPTPSSNTSPIRREKSFPGCGRLIVLQTVADTESFNLRRDAFSIDFPAMPDQIELARATTYKIATNMVMPDGIHQYMSTSPLEIPFSFKIHYADSAYCAEGPMTLLKTAARLHALVAPLGDSKKGVTVGNGGPLDGDGNPEPSSTPSKNDAVVNKTSGQSADVQGNNVPKATATAAADAKTDPPVTCRLELIYTGLETPGILCTGYVKDVKAVLFGPWLLGPNGAFNLPSAGEYSFTFVHRPGHGNWFSNKVGAAAVTIQAQAYATFIRDRLFNTRDLTSTSKFRGWTVPTS